MLQMWYLVRGQWTRPMSGAPDTDEEFPQQLYVLDMLDVLEVH